MTKAWKVLERKVAEAFNSERNLSLGRAVSDVTINVKLVPSVKFDIEVKLSSYLPKYLENVLGQAEKNCKEGRLPLGILKPKGKMLEGGYVVMRMRDFMKLIEREE